MFDRLNFKSFSNFFQSRDALSRLWKSYTMLLACIWAVEYFLVLGVPKTLCIDWDKKWAEWLEPMFHDDTATLNRFINFMFLPSGSNAEPDSNAAIRDKALEIIPDFFQLLLAVCQCSVFENENKEEWRKLAGSNDDESLDKVNDNPYRNFILAEPPTTLDRLKTFVFSMVYWVTFTVVLIAGTNRTSLFCLGYLVASFYFLYQGQERVPKFFLDILPVSCSIFGTVFWTHFKRLSSRPVHPFFVGDGICFFSLLDL